MAFVIHSDKKVSFNTCVRFPLDLVERIEKAIVGKDCTFSGFVIQSLRYVLAHPEDIKEEILSYPGRRRKKAETKKL